MGRQNLAPCLVTRGKMLLAVFHLLLLAVSPSLGANKGSINVEGYGEVWVIAPDWANINVGDNGFTLNGNSRMYFAAWATDGFDSGAYWQTDLMDKRFSYSIDVSNVGCHCNAAAYFINMPGNNAGAGDYYCDANFGNNIWCPEYDTYEGNKYTMAGTLHTCSGGGGNWDDCDRSGCQANIYNVDSNAMCPEDRCTINTNKWFQLSHYQNAQTANIWMEQDGKEYNFDICNDAGYVSNMASSYGGMVYSGSLWGGGGIDMGWLDGMTGCGGECNIDGSSVSFSNFALKSANEPDTTTTTTTTAAPTTTQQTPGTTTTASTTTTTPANTANPNCPGGSLAGCMALCPEEDADMFQACVKECIAACS